MADGRGERDIVAGGDDARFEFRVWADRLDEVGDRLGALSAPSGLRDSTETYLVSTAVADVNPKARSDLLDIKELVGVEDGFEQWTVRLKAEFPVEAALLSSELFPLLGVASSHLALERYSLSQLIAELVEPHPELAAVEVTKHRRMYVVDSCFAEFSDVAFAGRDLHTVAVESIDLDALRSVRRALGLEGRENVGYPRAIGRALGGRFAGLERGATE